MRRSLLLLVLGVCANGMADDVVNPTISGCLYSRLRNTQTKQNFEGPPLEYSERIADGMKAIPNQVHVYYWKDKKNLATAVTGKKAEDGRVVMVNAPGEATVRPDGTFSVTVNREALPAGVSTIGLVFQQPHRQQVLEFRLPGADAKAKADSRIDISDGRSEIDLGRIEVY